MEDNVNAECKKQSAKFCSCFLCAFIYRPIGRFLFCILAIVGSYTLLNLSVLTDPVAQIVKLSTANLTSSYGLNLNNVR